MRDPLYLYHYYPLRDFKKIEDIPNIENETIDSLLSGKNKNDLPFPDKDLHHINYLISEQKIWINKSENLNDPFECIGYICPNTLAEVTYPEHIEKTKSSVSLEEYKQALCKESTQQNNLIKYHSLENHKKTYYGIFCLSKTNHNSLMWSYYASGHTGICIRFKVNENLRGIIESKNNVSLMKYKDGPGFIFGKVHYEEEPAKLTFETNKRYKKLHQKLSSVLFGDSNIKISEHDLFAIDIAFSKHIEWNREEEYRFIALGLDDYVYMPSFTWPNTNEKILEPDAIIFGKNTSEIAKKIIQNTFKNLINSYFCVDIEWGSYNLKLIESSV